MGGVFDHGPHDFTDRQTAHDWTWRKWLSEILWAARAQELDRIRKGCVQYLASYCERGNASGCPGVCLKVEIKALRSRGAFDEPVKGLGRVRYLLRDGHHFFPRTEFRISLFKDSGGALKEFLAREQLFGKVIGLLCWIHAPNYIRILAISGRLVSYRCAV